MEKVLHETTAQKDVKISSIFKELEMAKTREKVEFTVADFVNLYHSCLEVYQKTTRIVSGQMVNSLPYDMDLQLGKLIAKMRKWHEPYDKARQNFGRSLGFKFNAQNGSLYLPEKKSSIDLTPAQKQERKSQNDALVEELEAGLIAMNESLFDEWDLLKKNLPLLLFTEEAFKEREMFFNGVENKLPFFTYCVK